MGLSDFMDRAKDHLKSRASAIGKEVFETVTDKIIPQGASEIAQALFTGNAYVPSVAERHEMETPTVESPKVEQPEVTAPEVGSHEAALSQYVSRGSNRTEGRSR